MRVFVFSHNPPPRRRQYVRSQPLERIAGVQQQAGAGARAIVGAKRAQVRGVFLTRARGGLDLDRQQAAAGLDHQIDFLAVR